jgi:hypothetical protein
MLAESVDLDNIVLPWETSARRAWSLWDMISWAITNYSGMYGALDSHIVVFGHSAKLGLPIATADMALESKKHVAETVVNYVLQEAKILKLEHTIQMAQQLDAQLKTNQRFSPELLVQELIKLKQLIIMETSKRKLAFIPAPYDIYFEQDRLFGNEVYDTFDEARQDLKDAGNCLAASLPTASVFHLMRVAEHGLRKLARKLGVKLTHTGKPMPIEFGDWNKVITAIKNKITQAKLELYSNAADHCEYMKDIWRNNTAHTRKPYSGPEAEGVLGRVRDFMQFLGKQVR